MSEFATPTMRGFGRISWSAVLDLLSGYNAVWSDLDGWHVESGLPDEIPRTATVWAWSESGLARIRPLNFGKSPQAIVAILPVGTGSSDRAAPGLVEDAANPVASEAVVVQKFPVVAWDKNRVGAEFAQLFCGDRVGTVYSVRGDKPVSFIMLGAG